MTITAYPSSGQVITETEYRDLFKTFISAGSTTAGGLEPFADSSGLAVKFSAGMAVIDGCLVKSSVEESRAVAAGSGGGLSRVDLLVANLDFSSTPIITFEVMQGTPAASGAAAPSLALTGTVVARWVLASIAVSSTASTLLAGDITDLRTFAGDPRIRIQEAAPVGAPLNTIWIW
jgi:hypothetical protein